MNKERVGRFLIKSFDGNSYNPDPRIMAVFGQCVPFEIKFNPVRGGYDCVAISPQFEPVPLWEVCMVNPQSLPEYEWWTEPDGKGGFKAEAKRVER